MHRGSGWYVDDGWWPDVLHGLIPILFLIAIVGFGVWAVLRLTGRGTAPLAAAAPPAPRPDGALEELRLRYARGEMERDDFVQRFRDLGDGEPGTAPPGPPEARQGDEA